MAEILVEWLLPDEGLVALSAEDFVALNRQRCRNIKLISLLDGYPPEAAVLHAWPCDALDRPSFTNAHQCLCVDVGTT